VPEWLSDQWCEEVAALAGSRPEVPGGNGTVSLTVTRGKGIAAAYHWAYKDGTPGAGGVGQMADADLVLTIGEADAALVVAGDVEPSVAYMRGRLKAAGDGGLLLGWLASTATDAYAEWRRRVAEVAGAPPAAGDG
jgi:hypothetical protein